MTQQDGSLLIAVRVAPRAAREAIAGVHDGALKVSLTAPPVEGAANAALIKLLSKRLGVPKRAVRIVAGEQSRNKRVALDGVDAATLRALVHGEK